MMQGATTATALADRLRAATWELHRRAERTGFVRDLLGGRASRPGYTLYLRNLLPAYEALERGLERHDRSPALAGLARPAVYRARAIGDDLVGLHGDDWAAGLPLLEVAERYARRLAEAAQAAPHRLVAHAYVRYLGDLNGGQILRRRLADSLELPPRCLGFYDFPAIADLDSFKETYRGAIDRSPLDEIEAHDVVEEARLAFRLNIELSEAVYDGPGPG